MGFLFGHHLLAYGLCLLLNHLRALQTVFLCSILELPLHGVNLVFYVDLEPVCFLSDRVVHLEACLGNDLVTDLPYSLVSSFLNYKDQLLIKSLLHLLQTSFQFRCRHMLISPTLHILIQLFNHLLKADEHIFITIDLFFELLLAGLSLFNLQVERFYIALNLLDALDYLLFKYFLTMLYGAVVVTTSDLPSSHLCIKLHRLTFVLSLRESTSAYAFIHHSAA